jgi:FkbM family methyltransferase
MQIDLGPDPYADAAKQARKVYSSLLSELQSAKTIYVGGITGPGGQYFLGETRFLCSLFSDLVYIDDFRAGTTMNGREVIKVGEFAQRADKGDYLINNCQSVAGFNHFGRQADSLGVRMCTTSEALAAFYKSGVPMRFEGLSAVYGPAFHEHALQNLDVYRKLRGVFSDRLSQRTFDDLIRYRLTGNPTYLHRVAVGHNYGLLQHDSYMLNKQFFTLSDDEVFIDAGALSGDSSDSFIRSVRGNFKRIVLFEPNSDSVAKCEERLKALDYEFAGKNILAKCDLIPKGLFGFTGELSFTSSLWDSSITEARGVMPEAGHIIDTGFGDAFTERGQEFDVVKVPVTSLDEVMGNDPVTFIKFEIEGSECDALKGAINTIQRSLPKMALSIYHRPQDLELIIQYVLDLNAGYKMALRAHNPICPDAIILYCWREEA